MNSKTTGIWFTIAAALLALIFMLERFLRPAAVEPSRILPELHPHAVTSVQVSPSGAFEIRADRTDGAWQLTKPAPYPAQSAAIDALLDALQKLTPVTRISATELRDHRNADSEFGFETPRISFVIETGDQRRLLLVGNKTPPGDQVFLRVVGVDGAFVADADWLKFIPRSADAWRDTALVDSGDLYDWIVLTNGTKVIELRRDRTNHLWRMIRPFPARAGNGRIMRQRWFVASRRNSMTFAPLVNTIQSSPPLFTFTSAVSRQSLAESGMNLSQSASATKAPSTPTTRRKT